jgi:hypothetical protein
MIHVSSFSLAGQAASCSLSRHARDGGNSIGHLVSSLVATSFLSPKKLGVRLGFLSRLGMLTNQQTSQYQDVCRGYSIRPKGSIIPWYEETNGPTNPRQRIRSHRELLFQTRQTSVLMATGFPPGAERRARPIIPRYDSNRRLDPASFGNASAEQPFISNRRYRR